MGFERQQGKGDEKSAGAGECTASPG